MAQKRIGDILVEQQVITNLQLKQAVKQKKENERLGETLVRMGMVNESQILKALEASTGIQRISLNTYKFDDHVFEYVDEEFCRANTIIPLSIDDQVLYYATADPLNYEANEDLRFMTGYRPKAFAAPSTEIKAQIEKYYGFSKTLDAMGASKKDEKIILQEKEEEVKAEDYTDKPMVQLVNQILTSAIFNRASDIHIDPVENIVNVRYRVDGTLETVRELPIRIHAQMVSRLKVMANMDITETRLPQDGRILTTINKQDIDLRVSSLPTVKGEKVVIRILDINTHDNNIETLGVDAEDEVRLRRIIAVPNGMVLVSGPTGSGKTTTLYSFLNELNQPNVNITTIEDPVEVRTKGINQVQIDSKIHLTFAAVLKSLLRQDPDIIMIGEIRDTETAEMAIRSALTGHLVLSTIHTNDAIRTVTRLLNMGIPPYLIASSLTAVIAQRLVRRLCNECKYEDEPTNAEKLIFEKHDHNIEKVYRAAGCPSCNYRGFAGRLGIFEIVEFDETMRVLISQNSNFVELKEHAKKMGTVFLADKGLEKVKEGLTTLDEVLRVTTE